MKLIIYANWFKVVVPYFLYSVFDPAYYFLNFWVLFLRIVRVIRVASSDDILRALAPSILVYILCSNLNASFTILNPQL